VTCTGLTEIWCPRCGDCACTKLGNGEPCLDVETCPLHGAGSGHADNMERARMAGVLEKTLADGDVELSEEDRAQVVRFAQYLSESSRKRKGSQ
jgi:hypothetical protein